MIVRLKHQATTTDITFCYGTKAYTKFLKQEHGLDERIQSSGVTTILTHNKTGRYSIVVGVKKVKDVYALKALVVHELSHVVSELMLEFGFTCDEFRSYTLQWLYQEIIPELDKELT